MAASLTALPIEVLANITSRLAAKDILERLFGIGNALLTYKLCHSGVVDLEINPSELSGNRISDSHIVASQSLSLYELSSTTEAIIRLPTGLCLV